MYERGVQTSTNKTNTTTTANDIYGFDIRPSNINWAWWTQAIWTFEWDMNISKFKKGNSSDEIRKINAQIIWKYEIQLNIIRRKQHLLKKIIFKFLVENFQLHELSFNLKKKTLHLFGLIFFPWKNWIFRFFYYFWFKSIFKYSKPTIWTIFFKYEIYFSPSSSMCFVISNGISSFYSNSSQSITFYREDAALACTWLVEISVRLRPFSRCLCPVFSNCAVSSLHAPHVCQRYSLCME